MSVLHHPEIAFEVQVDPGRGLIAHWDDPQGGGITTQGDDLNELQAMVLDAVRCHFEPDRIPARIRLHFTGDPVIDTHEARQGWAAASAKIAAAGDDGLIIPAFANEAIQS